MRTLLIHAGRFEYQVREKAVPNPEELDGAGEGFGENVLVVFTSVEASDGENPEGVAAEASREVSEAAEKLGVKDVILYPYAHLSSSLADGETAIAILKRVEGLLKAAGYRVSRSPFGWYKSFTLQCLGHPLSELSRVITPQPSPGKTVETSYKILDLDGRLYEPEKYRFRAGQEDFKALVEKEALKIELPGGKPRFLEYCRKFGVSWEPYSDLGHMRYSPEATLMFQLIEDYAWTVANALDIPIFQLKGTNMFNLAEKPVREHAKLFGEKLYEMEVERRRLVLRYAACHQQFSSVKDWRISYRQLPFGTFEVADSYRLERSGELLLCFRVRKLHMPDLHIYCLDLENAMDVSLRLHEKIYEEVRKLNREYVSIYNTTRRFFEENRKFFERLMNVERKPVLLNFVPEDVYYWVINVEYTIIDQLNRPREIATFQIDVGNAERFGISYYDKNGEKRFPPIIHTAIIGTVERYLFTLFDCAAASESRGEKPSLPLWLTPVQVRLIPVSPDLTERCVEVCRELNGKGVRADVDDREETLSKRVREAETAWIPYIIVMGKRELHEELLPVRVRGEGSIRNLTVEKLTSEIKERVKGYPYRPLTLPFKVSLRPSYR